MTLPRRSLIGLYRFAYRLLKLVLDVVVLFLHRLLLLLLLFLLEVQLGVHLVAICIHLCRFLHCPYKY